MNTINLQQSVNKLLANRILGSNSRADYINWAMQLMESGYESKNLYTLAGLDNEDFGVIDYYFEQVCSELGVNTEVSDTDAFIRQYALFVAESVASGTILIDEGLTIFVQIAYVMDYSGYSRFVYLSDDLYYLETLGAADIFYGELTSENKEEFALNEFRIFVEEQRLNINEQNIMSYVYCNTCGYFGTPCHKSKFLFNGYKQICNRCKSKNIVNYSLQKDRLEILKKLSI